MRAVRLTAPGELEIIDLPVPTPAADEALVRVIAYGPYGTDVSTFQDRYGRYVKEYPVGIGADFSGVVAAVGADVTNVAPGDRVSALSLEHCGVCANCTRGKTNLCLDKNFYWGDRQICCQEFTIVKARKLVRLPDGVSFDDGAMLAGVVEALNAFELMDAGAGTRLAVVGVGAMGLAAIGTAIALGMDVIAVGGTGDRARLASVLGAKHVIRIAKHGDDVSPQVLALSPSGYSFVFESTATNWGIKQAFAIAGLEARVAITGGPDVTISGWDVSNKELRIVGVRAGHHQSQAHALIAAKRLDLKPTIGARFSLAQAAEAFAFLSGPRASDIGRVIIDVSVP